MAWKDMKALGDAVDDQGGVMSTTLGDIRSTLGYERLGRQILGIIDDRLQSAGLGYFPTWLLADNEYPRYGQEIRLYRKGTAVAQVVEAVLDPTEVGDERLREAGGDAAEILKQVRALVC